MTNLCYVPKVFTDEHRAVIGYANRVLASYKQQGFRITLRGLYYQFIAADKFPNTKASYDRLGSIINDARLAGLVSWTAMEDSLRVLQGTPTVSGPLEAMKTMREKFKLDLWAGQEWQPEVWVEKDAMVGVMESICADLRVNMMACRGYMSQSSMWEAGQRMAGYIEKGKRPIVFHFGDHDPSGIDMTRDNRARLAMFAGMEVPVVRLGLNMAQVEKYNPPANFAKVTDSRYAGYVAQFGEDSWELDALHPAVIKLLIEDNVLKVRDEKLWAEALAAEAEDLDKIDRIIEAEFGPQNQEEEDE